MTEAVLTADGPSVATFRLFGTDVLVRPWPAESSRASGLVTLAKPEALNAMVAFGTVVAVPAPPHYGLLILRGDRAGQRVPLPFRVGHHVAYRSGFGPEVLLREGPHHVVGHGGVLYGHGILAWWEPTHTHCWHLSPERDRAECCSADCPAPSADLAVAVPLPSCMLSGPRLHETILGARLAPTRPVVDDLPAPGGAACWGGEQIS